MIAGRPRRRTKRPVPKLIRRLVRKLHDRRWRERLAQEGIPGETAKFTIEGVDCYFTVSYDAGRSVAFFQMVVSGGKNKNPLLEVVMDSAMREISSGLPLSRLVDAWIGTRFEPAGGCAQLGCMVKSPLDAAAKYLQARYLSGERG